MPWPSSGSNPDFDRLYHPAHLLPNNALYLSPISGACIIPDLFVTFPVAQRDHFQRTYLSDPGDPLLMASLSIPPPLSAPTSTRLDWGHSGERGSAFRGVSRGRGSGNRGDRGRGGRGGRRGGTSTRGSRPHGSPPTAVDNTNTPTTPTESAKPAQPPAVPPTNTSASTKNPSSSLPRSIPSLDLTAKPKASARRASQHAANNLPSLMIEPASPTVNLSGSAPHSASTSSSRPTARRRRSQNNKSSVATLSSENLTVEALASAMKARKSRTSPSSPHGPPKASASKDAPPHLSAGPTVTSFSTKTNIDSLVEHVRALAMDHRPSTPGSHIDWADEDDSLPDLDDWGVSPGSGTPAGADPGPSESIEKARLELMSPILDDSLKQLPQSFDKIGSPSLSAGSGSPSPRIADTAPISEVNGLEGGHVTGVPDTPSSSIEVDKQEDRVPKSSKLSPSEGPSTSPEPAPTSKDKDASPHLSSTASGSPSTTPPSSQSGRALGDSIHAPPRDERASSEAPPETPGLDFELDVGKRGLAASIHAPKSSSSSESRLSEEPRPAPEPRIPTHGRSRTLGRPPAFVAKHGFLSGSSTPAGAARADATKGPHHARTQSTPASHRQRQSRPVITMDARSRLARTLGMALPTKKEVTDTNVAASSE
ncbi:hypothetical protein H4582DRAFT_2068371 [Lactarius indigo]|nr:hypothetical protein H4582DRAFT_2068371 [Lactarius indigo]